MEYKRIDGKDLIEKTAYCLDEHGIDKVIYEGVILNSLNQERCLLTPIGRVRYITYGSGDYNGKYIGKFSLALDGYFYEEINNTTTH